MSTDDYAFAFLDPALVIWGAHMDGNEEEGEKYEGSDSEDDSNDNSDESRYASF